MTQHVRGRESAAALALALICAAALSACVKPKAHGLPDGPRLEMPAAPPRDVEPVESDAPAPVLLPEEPARTPTPRPRQPAGPAQPRPVEAPKPEPPRADPAPEAPKPTEEVPRVPSTLQATPPTAEGEVERSIRAAIARATADLNRIDYRALNADARTQYDTAKSFVRQAEAAVRAKNLLFAKNLADKAATLAAQLAAR